MLPVSAGRFSRASAQYTPLLAEAVAHAAIRHFEGSKYNDICCGPGTLAQALSAFGYTPAYALDYSADFLRAYCLRFPHTPLMTGDVLHVSRHLGAVRNTLFINSSGYFGARDIQTVFRNLPGQRLIANFVCTDLTKPKRPGRRTVDFLFPGLGQEALHCYSPKLLCTPGFLHPWLVVGSFPYWDGIKPERMFLFSRLPK